MNFEEALADLASEIGVPDQDNSSFREQLDRNPRQRFGPPVALKRDAQLTNFDPNWRDLVVQSIQDLTGNSTDDVQNRLLDLVIGSKGLGSNQGHFGAIDAAVLPLFADATETAIEGDIGGAAQGYALAALPFGIGRLLKPAAKAASEVATELSDLAARAKSLNPNVRLPAAPPGADPQKMLDELRQLVRGLEDSIPKGPSTSVPNTGGDHLRRAGERRIVRDHLDSNPFVQAIPGRQGLPTKKEQHRLASEFFDGGGQLPNPGPWGRATVQDVRNALAKQVSNKKAQASPRRSRLRRKDIPSLARAGREPRGPRQFPAVSERVPNVSAALASKENELQNLAKAYRAQIERTSALQSKLKKLTDEVPILREAPIDKGDIPKKSDRLTQIRNILDRINNTD